MKTRTLLLISGAFSTALCYHLAKETGAIIAFSTHVIIWAFHRLEVKVNKLLDHYGIQVSEKEMAE